ncbi:hypothetical protein GCM10009116_00330 [Brevundimonas basaltis]|uniref:Uncharacterized protein n=1 Tax=Brevundimonas basaltis TaxID=472166 RepID=A0A7W8I1N2_9CAUL|nr:hypothetical protein [Brevundimonas basaltis]MBB5292945.1 hypothetical protein [Brevundimonas basaltis]
MSISIKTGGAAVAALAITLAAGAVHAQDRGPAQEQAPATHAESPVVVERGPNGRATAVRIGATTYKVCQTEREDGCIQPRAAGLGWGDRPLQSWPGESRGDRAAARSGR